MVDNKNTNKDAPLSEKIGEQENVNSKEIAKDISAQQEPKSPSASPQEFSQRVAQEEGISVKEVRKDIAEQKIPAVNKDAKIWIYVGLAVVVIGIIVWLINKNS